MKKHNACIATFFGWVEVDNENGLAVNCVVRQQDIDILDSSFYKSKENIFWPEITKNKSYISSYGKNILMSYNTEYIHNILRYPEFTPTQFKETLLFMCDVLEYCCNNNVWLRTHLWNVTYNKGKPIIIDIRDFEKYTNQSWKTIFLCHFSNTTNHHCPIHVKRFVENHTTISDKLRKCNESISEIRKIFEEIKIVESSVEKWSDYHSNRTNFIDSYDSLTDELYEKIKYYNGGGGIEKSFNLLSYIEEIKPKNIIEIGCNNGIYCIAASRFSNVVGIDYDKVSIEKANQINKNFNTPSQFCYANVLDHEDMSHEWGVNGCYDSKINRFRSEMLIAPAIIHHLFDQCKSTDKIISIFNMMAIKYMVIELIPNVVDEFELYTSIDKYNWIIKKTLPSSPSPRKWIVCEKRLR